MILKTIHKISFVKKAISKILDAWVENKTARFIQFLPHQYKILDIGSGNCLLTNNLIKKGYDVTAIDVKNLSILPSIQPIIYDGTKLPFKRDTFDAVLLLTVLHHCDTPKSIIEEAKRVSDTIIIIEDTYNNTIQKVVTQFIDLIVNLGHSKMTYQNKTEAGWEDTFNTLGLEILSKRRKSVLLFFRQTTYHLKKSL